MNAQKHIMQLVYSAPPVAVEKRFFGNEALASEELKTARQAVCSGCSWRKGLNCTGCCGGVPVSVAVVLQASKCPKKKW